MKPSERFNSLIQYYADRVMLPYDLVRRQVEAESAFNPKAESPVGAKGLLQLMPGAARDVGVGNPFDPDENLRGGTEYLARQAANVRVNLPHSPVDFPDDFIHRLALVAYNGGFAYVRAAMRAVEQADLPLTWESFCAAFKSVDVRGKRPRWQESLAYAEKILPVA